MSWKYEDMLYLPHPVSQRHPPMPMIDRGAQFAPFAALTGHDAVIRETARLVEQPIELDPSRREELDAQLRELARTLEEDPVAAFTHYVPDLRKTGGAYVRTTGRVKKIDPVYGVVVLADGSGIEIHTIIDVEVG